MKVVILGGSGFVGRQLALHLAKTGRFNVTVASRRPVVISESIKWVPADVLDINGLSNAIADADVVVNSVAGDERTIANGAEQLVRAARSSRTKRVVHLSSMAVYGAREGLVTEQVTPIGPLGWYGRAKVSAEMAMSRLASGNTSVVIFRPGCVVGPESEQWVGRIGRLLQSRRLGDLGKYGDGWSNLVHVEDIAQAVVRAIDLPEFESGLSTFNLAAPDSPRWNDYFVDFACAIGATPVVRIGRQVVLDGKILGPALKIAEKVLGTRRIGWRKHLEPITPGLIGLWQQDIRLDSQLAIESLKLDWRPYKSTVVNSAEWYVDVYGS